MAMNSGRAASGKGKRPLTQRQIVEMVQQAMLEADRQALQSRAIDDTEPVIAKISRKMVDAAAD